ncbi:serine hydrolase domain-containing protein [Candidatus Latescibacterota bacterium]
MKRRVWIYTLPAIFLLTFILNCSEDSGTNPTTTTTTLERLETATEEVMATLNLPGVEVAIWIPGEGEYRFAKGTADLENNIPYTTGQPFRIASITKTFVATVILQLVDSGLLNLSDNLSTYFPSFPNAGKITILHLLSMRSGIPDYADDEAFVEETAGNPLREYVPADLMAVAASHADEFIEPDTETRYCNTNYIILGEIAALVTGTDIGALITEKIIAPLGLVNTQYPTGSSLVSNVKGYSWDTAQNAFVDYTDINPSWSGAAGAMISTSDNLRIYVEALYKGTLLSSATQTERMKTMGLQGMQNLVQFGAGIMKLGPYWGHSGGIVGFSSEMWYLPEKDAVVIINVNRHDIEGVSQSLSLLIEITGILFPQYLMSSFSKPLPNILN